MRRSGAVVDGGVVMRANSPGEICEIFRQAMARGDLEAVFSVYDPEAVFAGQSGDVEKHRSMSTQSRLPVAKPMGHGSG
jgi:hypothetical protein